MKSHFKNTLIVSVIVLLSGCSQDPVYSIFDSNPPDIAPKVFADNLFSGDGSYVGYCTFNHEEKTLYYATTNQQWNISHILRRSPDKQIDTLKLHINELWAGEPMFTPDEKRMYFTAITQPDKSPDWHADLFYIEKTDAGWSAPKTFALNSPKSEWHISFTKDQVAYFGSEREGSRLRADIYYSKLENGEYQEAIKLPAPLNTEYNDCDPLISPDESYLIFHSDRPSGYGAHDLYIAFRNGENDWNAPVNMGETINTEGWEMGPSLSPDGKYLFFTRRKSWDTEEPSKIFWVKTDIVERYK